MIAPTIDCVIETGTKGNAGKLAECRRYSMFVDENKNNTSDEPSTDARAVIGLSLKISPPTVSIFLLE